MAKTNNALSNEIEILKKEFDKMKVNKWEKVKTFSTIISSLIIGVSGILITYYLGIQKAAQDEQQFRIELNDRKDTESMKYYELLGSKDPIKRRTAEFALTYYERANWIIDWNRKDSSFEKSATHDELMASNLESITSVSNTELKTESEKTLNNTQVDRKKEGWVYIGDYEESKWITRYYNFKLDTKPEKLLNSRLNPLYKRSPIRSFMPSNEGSFGKVIGFLDANASVIILEVAPWSSTGYYWAKVKVQ
jgi:hypothetical protein